MTDHVRHPATGRPLTDSERKITTWLITHARVSEGEKERYLDQLSRATVVRTCGCGCPSVDFAISGVASIESEALDPFGDFMTKDRAYGIFVFSKRGDLAGIDLYQLSGTEIAKTFPEPSELEPV